MFKSLNEVLGLFSIIIGAASDLCQAGRLQAQVILLASEEDVAVKSYDIAKRRDARVAALTLLEP